MDEKLFAFWLHGWMEIQKPKIITKEQLTEIKNHLKLIKSGDNVNSFWNVYASGNSGNQLIC
jgi:hypothetical protein